MSKVIHQGAEAKIFLEGKTIVKERFSKEYREKAIDEKLRKSRTKREAKVLSKLPVRGPKLLEVDDKNMIIKMEYLKGKTVKDAFDKYRFRRISRQIGQMVAELHNNNIIHGDLTTSNMILYNDYVYFIDFGLSFFSHKIEDKAVDLHLLRQALESKHYQVDKLAFREVLRGYKSAKDYDKIIERFNKVELRGRHKTKD